MAQSINSVQHMRILPRVRAFCGWHDMFAHAQDILIPIVELKHGRCTAKRCASLGSMLTLSCSLSQNTVYIGGLPQLCFDMEPSVYLTRVSAEGLHFSAFHWEMSH